MTTETTPVVTTAIIPAQRVFRKAREVLQARLTAVNPRAAELNFQDFTAKVDTTTNQVTLAVVGEPTQQYDVSNLAPFTYVPANVENFVFVTLNFAREYKLEQKDAVVAALPEGLTITLDNEDEEGNVTGTITVDAQVTDINFADSITPASLFLEPAGTTTIKFLKEKDPIIDLAEYLPGGDLGEIAAEDLLEAIEQA